MGMIKAGIMGATGYGGSELVRILYHHPEVESKVLSSKNHNNQEYTSIYENFRKICELKCQEIDFKSIGAQLDVLFLALPHGETSKLLTNSLLNTVKIIDLSADFRLKNADVYEEWYNIEHNNKDLLNSAIYGLCEWNRNKIINSRMVANPGCYPTSILLGLLPLIKEGIIEKENIIIDAKSGVSGAGRSLNLPTHYTECNESIKAYNVTSHRHTPEIELFLNEVCGFNSSITFTAHLVPMNRGILATGYGILNKPYKYDEIKYVYEKYYNNEYFIRLTQKGVLPETKWVKGSNYCDIGFVIDKRADKLIFISAIDNLVKGASGQAVQNMNLMFNLKENVGLKSIPIFPV
jgi:N-acetyl-gamma-glutamyl-phosphate reductase